MQVHFLPWAAITKPLAIGPVTIRPWQEAKGGIRPNIRQFLDTYFARHVTNDGRQVRGISIAWVGDDPIGDITIAQRETIRRAVDILIFEATISSIRATLASRNANIGLPHSERFQLVTQLFRDARGSLSISSGGTLHAWNMAQIHFCMPWHVGSSTNVTDDALLRALGGLLSRRRGARQRERIFRAIEWFRLAHTGSDEVTDQSRLVMMATAFEVLLEPDNPFGKRKLMMQKLSQITQSPRLRVKTFHFRKEAVVVNAVAAWFARFYDIRNGIVHGNRVRQRQLQYPIQDLQWFTHLHVADLVFWEVIAWELVDSRLLGSSARRIARRLARRFDRRWAKPSLIRRMTAGLAGIDVEQYHNDLNWNRRERGSA